MPRPTPRSLEDPRLAAHLDQLVRFPAYLRRLRSAATVADLLADAAALTQAECGYGRALVLGVEVALDRQTLTARSTAALADPESDRLRRRVLAAPVAVRAGTLEYDLVRDGRPRAAPRPSVLADALGLEAPAIAAVAPDGAALALLVADRPAAPVPEAGDPGVVGVAVVVGMALEHLITKTRLAEVAIELNHLTRSAQAMMHEALNAPPALPADRGVGPAFSRQGVVRPSFDIRERLSAREEQIAQLLVEGRSNVEIAERLTLSHETVKTYVARLRRKLNAANRVEAASLYLRLVQRSGE